MRRFSFRKRTRGIMLVITLLFMIILGFMSLALFQMVPQDLRQSLRHQQDLAAHHCATSGIKHALGFMSSVLSYDPLNPAVNWTPVANNPFSAPAAADYNVITVANPQAEPWLMLSLPVF